MFNDQNFGVKLFRSLKMFFLSNRLWVWYFEFWPLEFICYLGSVFCDLRSTELNRSAAICPSIPASSSQ